MARADDGDVQRVVAQTRAVEIGRGGERIGLVAHAGRSSDGRRDRDRTSGSSPAPSACSRRRISA